MAGEAVRAAPATLDLDALSSIEERSYREGYSDGDAHGKLHGTFEGRQLGIEKGFELWQELGHMEAATRIWLVSVTREGGANGGEQQSETRKRQKLIQQLESLLVLIDGMPMDNCESVDIGAAMERIRAKYKLTSLSFIGAAEATAAAHAADQHVSKVTIKGRQVDASQLHF